MLAQQGRAVGLTADQSPIQRRAAVTGLVVKVM